jgi:DNA gyrase/topoisomerase IV subunit A
MIEQDTVKLLRECDAGIKMGVSSINDVLPHVQSKDLKNILTECKRRHETLNDELQQRLDRFGDEGKEPNPIAKGMSWMKTNMKMNLQESDATIADLMTDGCNMGVKSLSKYLNQYKAAEEYSKDIAKKLIHLEAQLAQDIRGYL